MLGLLKTILFEKHGAGRRFQPKTPQFASQDPLLILGLKSSFARADARNGPKGAVRLATERRRDSPKARADLACSEFPSTDASALSAIETTITLCLMSVATRNFSKRSQIGRARFKCTARRRPPAPRRSGSSFVAGQKERRLTDVLRRRMAPLCVRIPKGAK